MKTETLENDSLYWASFNCFELRIPGEAVKDIARSGPADEAVAYWAPKIAARITADDFTNKPTPEKIRGELKEHGAWDAEELADDSANFARLVWIAACNIGEEESPDCTEPVKKP